jgi:hypothetical protein
MAAAGKPILREFIAAGAPEAVIRDVVLQAEEFDRLGYRLESHTPATAVLARRFTPTVAYAAPLTIAALAFFIPVLSPHATTQQAATGGRIALFALIAAFVLSLLVKTTERLTVSASVEGDRSRVLISGSATPALSDWVRTSGGAAGSFQRGAFYRHTRRRVGASRRHLRSRDQEDR